MPKRSRRKKVHRIVAVKRKIRGHLLAIEKLLRTPLIERG